nr:hypothetical protein Iba_chr02aCG12500 [Ipomoea batatas]
MKGPIQFKYAAHENLTGWVALGFRRTRAEYSLRVMSCCVFRGMGSEFRTAHSYTTVLFEDREGGGQMSTNNVSEATTRISFIETRLSGGAVDMCVTAFGRRRPDGPRAVGERGRLGLDFPVGVCSQFHYPRGHRRVRATTEVSGFEREGCFFITPNAVGTRDGPGSHCCRESSVGLIGRRGRIVGCSSGKARRERVPWHIHLSRSKTLVSWVKHIAVFVFEKGFSDLYNPVLSTETGFGARGNFSVGLEEFWSPHHFARLSCVTGKHSTLAEHSLSPCSLAGTLADGAFVLRRLYHLRGSFHLAPLGFYCLGEGKGSQLRPRKWMDIQDEPFTVSEKGIVRSDSSEAESGRVPAHSRLRGM